jgi:hypothetical protein
MATNAIRQRVTGGSVLLILALSGCVKEFPNKPIENQKPKTYFWLYPDSALAEGVSKQRLHWWGEDPDGYVIGYLFGFARGLSILPSPDTLTYRWTSRTDSVVQFPLLTARADFFVAVRSVDNTFDPLPEGAIVRLSPDPYWDRNGNGIYDDGDVKIPALVGALDPAGARQKFPIRNSPPRVDFLKDPSDPTRTIEQPETTFTVASFSWVGTDPDGNETIASYRISLNDTAANGWLTIPSTVTLITLNVPRSRSDGANGEVEADVYSGIFPSVRLVGTVRGLRLNATNVFYLQARDVAGDYSAPVRLPGGTRTWYVKKPQSRLLVISDYQKSDSVTVRSNYRTFLSAVAGGVLSNFDLLDIRYGAAIGSRGIYVPYLLNPAFVLTLKLFDYVIWYTDQFPSLGVAQFPLYLYSSTGGKVLYTTEFASAVGDPRGSLVDFAPLDSVSSVDLSSATRPFPSLGDTRIPAGYVLYPDSSIPSNIYPTLSFNSTPSFHLFFMRPIYKRADARYIYRLQPDQRSPIRYVGSPNVGVIDDAKRFVFLAIPLHLLNGSANGGQGVSAFLQKVFVEEFGLQ